MTFKLDRRTVGLRVKIFTMAVYPMSHNIPSKHKTFVLHLYEVGPTFSTLVQQCKNVIQKFCVSWVGIQLNAAAHSTLNNTLVTLNNTLVPRATLRDSDFLCAQVVQPFLATDTHEPMFTFSVFFILIITITVFTNAKK